MPTTSKYASGIEPMGGAGSPPLRVALSGTVVEVVIWLYDDGNVDALLAP
jgi:hypothetical protein